jgi:AraC-like DNA-binding protein/uncharacterized membrane protein affecting hemolysin expression
MVIRQKYDFTLKKYYIKLLMSFITIIIMAMFFGFVVVSYTYRILEKEVQATNSMALKQLQTKFDAEIIKAENLLTQVSLDKNITLTALEDYYGKKLECDTIFQLRNIIKTFQNDSIHDLFLYYKNSDRIISSVYTSFTLDMYFDAYYKINNNEHVSFLHEIEKLNVNRIFKFEKEDSFIAVAQSLPISKIKNHSVTAVCILKNPRINIMLEEARCNGGEVSVFDKNGMLLTQASSKNVIREIDNIANIEKYDDRNNCYTERINNKNYIVSIKTSSLTGCKYIITMPTSIYWNKLNLVRVFCIIITIIFTILGAIIACLLLNKNYSPISKLVATVKEKAKPQHYLNIKNEIEFIERFIDIPNVQQDMPCDGFLKDLFQGIYPVKTSVIDMFSQYGITLTSLNFVVTLFKIESANKDMIDNIYEDELGTSESAIYPIIKNVISELCKEIGKAFVLYDNSDTYICLLNTPDDLDTHAKKASEIVVSFLNSNLKISCTAAYGKSYKAWEGVFRSYNEALEAMQYKIIYGAGSIISYKDVIKKNLVYNSNFEQTAQKLISSYIKTGLPSVDDILLRIQKKCFKGKICTPDEYKCFFYDMNNLINLIVQNLNIENQDLEAKLFAKLLEPKDLVQYESTLNEILNTLRNTYVEESRKISITSKDLELCNNIKKYIEDNYSNYNLGVGEIGHKLNITPSYLSRRFKYCTGVTITDYIVKTRHEKAKELLKNTDMTIKNIALKVGYLSSTVFIRSFKSKESITPGSYRNI